jgi:hypothetical protein
MTKHFNKLTPAEAERLALLVEEAGDVIHLTGAILRRGYESEYHDPDLTLRELLEKKLGNLQHAIDRLCESKDVDPAEVKKCRDMRHKLMDLDLRHQGGAS